MLVFLGLNTIIKEMLNEIPNTLKFLVENFDVDYPRISERLLLGWFHWCPRYPTIRLVPSVAATNRPRVGSGCHAVGRGPCG
jgi:hypothetical protein